MTRHDADILRQRETFLGSALRPVAGELRLIGVAELASAIWGQKYANLEDLVNSSAELYFRPGTLTFGWGGDVSLGWAVPPAVSLDMEFQSLGVTVFFRLKLQDARACLSIRRMSLDVPGPTPEDDTLALIGAVADASIRSQVFRATRHEDGPGLTLTGGTD